MGKRKTKGKRVSGRSERRSLRNRRLGKALAEARLGVGFTQTDVAHRVGVSTGRVSHWETGRNPPTEEQLSILNSFLDVEGPQRALDVSGSFGAWLARERTRANITAAELSRKSGISWMQIRNIESGRTNNPRDATKKRLSAALGASLPEDASTAAKKAAEIRDVGTLVDFDPYDQTDVPDEPGVYVLYDISQRPVYVGQGDPISRRVSDHATRFWFKPPIVEAASYVRIENGKLRRQVEQVLIRFLKSNAVINKQGVDRD